MLSKVGASYDAFESLCDAAFPDGENGLMFFWKACFDGSGSHSDLLVVAGYLGNRDQWKAFNKAWRLLLTTNGVFVPFHAADFESGNRDFSEENGWPRERREAVRPQLVDALLSAQLEPGIACCVKIKDYEETIDRWKRESKGLATAYEFAVSACMGTVAYYCQLKKQEDPVHYIVEHGDGRESQLTDAFKNAFAREAARKFFRLGGLTFDTKNGAIGLQAADMLANYMWNWKTGNRPDIEPYSRITHDPKLVWDYFDKERLLREMAQDKAGRVVNIPNLGSLTFRVPEPIHIEVTADFSETEKVVAELERLSEPNPQGVYSLIERTSSFEKLFSVEAENASTGEANELRITLKPRESALSGIAALRTPNSDGSLGEGGIRHEG